MKSAILTSAKRMYLLYAFFFGIIIGTLFLDLIASDYFNQVGIFSNYFIDKFNSMEINKIDLLSYTFISRIKEMALVLIFSFTALSTFYNFAYCTFLGFSTGVFISCATINSGIKGVLFYILSIFPHYIVYIVLIIFTINKSVQINRYVYLKKSELNLPVLPGSKNMFLNIALIIVIILVLCLIEALLEVYINTSILKKILKSY